jgi:hypothetical protein
VATPTTDAARTVGRVDDQLLALVVLFVCPVLFGGLFWLLIKLEGDVDDPGSTPFDPPPGWW